MFDHDNQTAAAAAPVSEEGITAGNPSVGGQSEGQSATTHEIKLDEAPVKAASEALHEGVPADAHAASQATSHETSPEAGHAIAPAALSETEAHAKAEAQSATHAADAEASSDADEAAGSEEMSKLMEQYDEKQEAAASKEVIE